MPFALRNTYAHFKRNPWCGGLTGELRVERPYRNFLTSVQYMEWKVRRCCGVGSAAWDTSRGRHQDSALLRHCLRHSRPCPHRPCRCRTC